MKNAQITSQKPAVVEAALARKEARIKQQQITANKARMMSERAKLAGNRPQPRVAN